MEDVIHITHIIDVWSTSCMPQIAKHLRALGCLIEWNSLDALNKKQLWDITGLDQEFIPAFAETSADVSEPSSSSQG